MVSVAVAGALVLLDRHVVLGAHLPRHSHLHGSTHLARHGLAHLAGHRVAHLARHLWGNGQRGNCKHMNMFD